MHDRFKIENNKFSLYKRLKYLYQSISKNSKTNTLGYFNLLTIEYLTKFDSILSNTCRLIYFIRTYF